MDEFDLPNGWIKSKLSNVTEPRGEKALPSEYPNLPFLGMDHIEAQTTRILGSVSAGSMKSSAARFYAGDVLYGRLRPYLNKVAQPAFDGLASAEFIVFPDTKITTSKFLKFRLNAADFVSFASHLNEGDRPRVNFEQIGEFEVLVPPIKEQHRIVAKIEALFSELDKGIESFKTAREQLKIYRQSLLKNAFSGKLTEQWRAENPDKLESAETLLQRIQTERQQRYQQQLEDWESLSKSAPAPLLQRGEQAANQPTCPSANTIPPFAKGGLGGISKPKPPKTLPPLTAEELAELPELPAGWTYSYLADLGDLGRGKSKHRPRNDPRLFGGSFPFIQTGEVKAANRIIRKYINTLSDFGLQQSKLWPTGTLCITIAANIAETAFLGFDGCFPDSVVGFSAFETIVAPEYVDFFIQAVRTRIEAYAPATAQKNINLETLENLVVPYCCLNEQKQIIDILDERFSILDQFELSISASLQQAEALRQSILKKAFSGQLVPQDPNDEPASVLLERIRAEKAQANIQPARRRGKTT